ncbi:hypothetical protein V8F06_002707 [Rhypophila decipiens]
MNRPDQSPLQQQPAGWAGGDEWDEYRATIQDLYLSQNLSLKEVMKRMEEEHGFKATQRMYKTRIKSWGLDKNFKESEVVELFRLQKERERQGKTATTYCIRGREVDWERVLSYVRRKGLNMAVLINTAPQSPSSGEVSCRTPTPEDVEQRNMLAMSPASSSASTSVGTRTPVSAMHYRPPSPHEVRGPLPPPQPYRAPSTSSSSGSFSTQRPETIHRLQSFLSRIYETVLYEDGDKSWGTTEYWLRNARSQEWIMTARYKLALYKDFIRSETARGSPEVLRFRAINRSFAMLEPLSGGVIGSRMFYLVSFFYAFAETSPFQNPFATTARQLLEALEASSAVPSLSSLAPSSENVRYSSSRDEDHDMEGSEPDYNNNAPPRTPRFADGQASFQESAGRFLAAVLSRMVKMLGLTLPSESLLLLEGTKDGYPLLPPSDAWRYPPPIIQRPAVAHPSPSPPHHPSSSRHQPRHHNHHHHAQHLSPHPDTTTTLGRPDLQVTASMLDHAVWVLAAQRKDARAEEMLLSLLSAVDNNRDPAPTTPTTSSSIPSSPSNNSSSFIFSTSSPSETGGGRNSPHYYSSREAKVLARCAHYHLSRICQRRAAAAPMAPMGDRDREQWAGRAREHFVRAVRGSLLFDSFLGWEEVEFLFA